VAISREELLRLARAGAVARVQELQNELESIFKTFPDLRRGAAGAKRTPARQAASAKQGAPAVSKRGWTAADRKAVSDRMKKYWAARRKADAAK